MDQSTQQNAAMVEESTAASHRLATEAQSLNRLLERFKLGRDAAALQPASVASRPVASPARSLGNKLAAAFGGGAAAAATKQAAWEDF
jgi:methyl-accepting chemotaxis protein